MYFLDNKSGVAEMPPIADTDNTAVRWFTEGGINEPVSWLGADWLNTIQAELLNILAAANITPDKTQLSQLQAAIQQIIEDRIPAASLTEAGIVQLSSAINSSSEELAATPKAVLDVLTKALTDCVPKTGQSTGRTQFTSNNFTSSTAIPADTTTSLEVLGKIPLLTFHQGGIGRVIFGFDENWKLFWRFSNEPTKNEVITTKNLTEYFGTRQLWSGNTNNQITVNLPRNYGTIFVVCDGGQVPIFYSAPIVEGAVALLGQFGGTTGVNAQYAGCGLNIAGSTATIIPTGSIGFTTSFLRRVFISA